jgi:ATP-dependent RNA helicase RhlE
MGARPRLRESAPESGPGLRLHSLLTGQPKSRGSSLDTAFGRERPSCALLPGSIYLKDSILTAFTDFGLAPQILSALTEKGYSAPTPIQAQTIPAILAGRDVCGIAQTGTGKTAAFALPILTNLAKAGAPRHPRSPRVLVLTPTRELASQIDQNFRIYGEGLGLRTTTIFGGVSQRPQADAIRRGVDVIIATPGRLLDLIDQRLLSLSSIEVLVVDEADQMLDLGFIVPLKKIVKMVPAKRQTLFFSATMPGSISHLADAILTDPVQVAVAPVASTAERVEQSVIFVSSGQKQAVLDTLLKAPEMDRVLVFTRTKHGADKVVKSLERAGYGSAAIHGNKSQAQRERALAAFKNGSTRVLVATDIAARGIHVESVSHVVNYDLPNVPESYVHRIGRTARAGAAGIAISFCNGEERAYLKDIEKLTRLRVPVAQAPAGIEVDVQAFRDEPPEEKRGSRRGGRPQQRAGASQGRPNGNRPQAHKSHGTGGNGGNGGQQRSGGRGRSEGGRSEGGRAEGTRGLDQSTGLPQFLSHPQQRRGGDARP